jgi:hypothetical protein
MYIQTLEIVGIRPGSISAEDARGRMVSVNLRGGREVEERKNHGLRLGARHKDYELRVGNKIVAEVSPNNGDGSRLVARRWATKYAWDKKSDKIRSHEIYGIFSKRSAKQRSIRLEEKKRRRLLKSTNRRQGRICAKV